MMYKHCKLCGYEDDIDYLHPLYDGKSKIHILICEKCRKDIFSDRERLSEKDKNYFGMKAIFRDGLCYLENGKIIDPDQEVDVCDSPTTPTKGSETDRNDQSAM